jgi:DHA1 family bicyclomycin/chloramphenicol resistance-like MFS transporter
MRPGLVLGLTLGGIYTLAALLPFVLIETVGLTPTQFGVAMIAQTGSYTLGAALTGRLLGRFDSSRLIPVGLGLILIASAGLGIGLRIVPASLLAVMLPVATWAFGCALVIPGATTGALAGYGSVAGAASALTGFLQIGGGLAGSAVAALVFPDPFAALTTVLPGMALSAAAAFLLLAPRRAEAAPADVPADAASLPAVAPDREGEAEPVRRSA